VSAADTRVRRGPGADRPGQWWNHGMIIASIRDRLLVLPGGTVVRAGHGDTTTIGDEAEGLDGWDAHGA